MQFQNPFQKAKLYRYPYGDIVQKFGEHPEAYGRLGLAGHNGDDLYQPYGTVVLAICDGEIAEVKYSPEGFGRHIKLISDWEGDAAYEITYGHLSLIPDWITPGAKVKAGDIIGYCGNSGFVVSGGVALWGDSNPDKKGTHLHIGVRELSKHNTGWQSTYQNGKTYFVKNYNNGFKGAIDITPFWEDEIKKQAIDVIETAKRFLLLLKGRIINQ